MVLKCCAIGCTNKHGRAAVSFYRFPANQEQRKKWIAAVGREDWQPCQTSRVCSAHFVRGKRDLNPLSPDFVPSIFNHISIEDKGRNIKAVENFERIQKMKKELWEAKSTTTGAEAIVGLATSSSEESAVCQRETPAACDGNVKMVHSCSGCLALQLSVDGVLESPEKLWNFLADHDLVRRTVKCSVCKRDLKANGFSRFHCKRETKTFIFHKMVTQRCNFNIPAHRGTFFEHSTLPLRKIVHLCYLFVLDTVMYIDVMEKLEVPLHRLLYWYSFCREALINYCLSNSKKIGGPGKTVQVTEAKVREKKYSGPSKKDQWFLGGLEKDSRSFFLIPIPDRDKEMLTECIKEWILPETEIISDPLALCSSLSLEGYKQNTVQHSTSLANTESGATVQISEHEPQEIHEGATSSGGSTGQFVGHLSMAYFKLAFPSMLERFHQFLLTVAALYPLPKEKYFARVADPKVEDCPSFMNRKKKGKMEMQEVEAGSTDEDNPLSLGPQTHTGEEDLTVSSIGFAIASVPENEEKIPHEVEIEINAEQHPSPGTAEDPLAVSPCHPAAWEDTVDAEYVENLPVKQKEEYLSKLILEKYSINLPDPYNLVGWMSDVKMWPDLNHGHIHQYLLCSQNLSAQRKDVVTAAAEGYDTFKLGNVLEVENIRPHSDLPVCILKAKVKPLKITAAETYNSWVCLAETHGTILASHCTCLTRFEEVCSHIVALLFRVEAAVSLGMNQEDLDNGNNKLAVWNRFYRPRVICSFTSQKEICVARMRDINFIHPNSNKRHKKLYKQFKPQPLSESEQMEALTELKKILPNAPVFMEDISDTDTASMFDESYQRDPTLYHHEQTALEVPVSMEDTDVPVKIEFDEAPSRMEPPEMALRLEDAELPLKIEEDSDVSLGVEFFEMAYDMEDAEVSVKSEDDVFVKMEEVEENPCVVVGDYVHVPND